MATPADKLARSLEALKEIQVSLPAPLDRMLRSNGAGRETRTLTQFPVPDFEWCPANKRQRATTHHDKSIQLLNPHRLL